MKNLPQPKNAQDLESALLEYPRIFIDLDHTVYDRFDYDFFAFQDMAKNVLNFDDERATQSALWLWDLKEKEGPHYRYLFDDFITFYDLKPSVAKDLIAHYRACNPTSLNSKQSLRPILARLKQSGHEIIIITNGEKSRQNRKIEALNLRSVVDDILILDPADEGARLKPDPHVIQEFERLRGRKRAVIVGDDLTTDGQLAINTDLDFIHYEHTGVQRGRFLSDHGVN